MKTVLLIFLGGGLGSVLRFLASRALNPLFQHFYLGTFIVNILGCLLLGFFFSLFHNRILSEHQYLIFATGFCGGFTTFSAFALENHNLFKSGEVFPSILYILLSITVGLAAIFAGAWLAKLL